MGLRRLAPKEAAYGHGEAISLDADAYLSALMGAVPPLGVLLFGNRSGVRADIQQILGIVDINCRLGL